MALYFDLGNDYTKLEKELIEKNRLLNERLQAQTLINETLTKQLSICGVSHQRELLGWMEEQGNFNIHNSLDIDEVIDGFAESKT